MEYGISADSRIEAQGKVSVLVWAMNKVQDTVGNYLTVAYHEENANGSYFPVRIAYTGNATTGLATYNAVHLEHQIRPDITPMYQAGSLIRSYGRLDRIRILTGATSVREYRLAYDNNGAVGRSRLTSLTECAGDGVCLPATTFAWSGGNNLLSGARWATRQGSYGELQKWFPGDFNGDGKTDYAKVFNDAGAASIDVHVSTGSGFSVQRWATRQGGYWDAQRWLVSDFNGDGKSDFAKVFNDDGIASIDVHLAATGAFIHQRWMTRQEVYMGSHRWFAGDFNGDGRADVANLFDDSGAASINVYISIGTFIKAKMGHAAGRLRGNTTMVRG